MAADQGGREALNSARMQGTILQAICDISAMGQILQTRVVGSDHGRVWKELRSGLGGREQGQIVPGFLQAVCVGGQEVRDNNGTV